MEDNQGISTAIKCSGKDLTALEFYIIFPATSDLPCGREKSERLLLSKRHDVDSLEKR